MIILHMGEMRENVVFSTEANAEYVHLIEDVNVWFIDYNLMGSPTAVLHVVSALRERSALLPACCAATWLK